MPALDVHLLYNPAQEDLSVLRATLDASVNLTFGNEFPSPASFQVLVAGRPTRAHLDASPEIHSLVIPFAGLPAETADMLPNYPHLAVYNLHHNADATAEMAIALLLGAAKYLLPFDQELRRGDWTRRYQASPALQLKGRTALLLGLGEIGRRVARICHALGMRVLATRRNPRKPTGLDFSVEVYPPEDLPSLLPQAQVLVITLPYTADTENLLSAEEIARLPGDCVLVNVGRGPIIDQAALYHALKTGRLKAAGLDVWYRYPATPEERRHTEPADFPFRELENVVLSPHRAGLVEGIEQERYLALAILLNNLANGRPAENRITLSDGY